VRWSALAIVVALAVSGCDAATPAGPEADQADAVTSLHWDTAGTAPVPAPAVEGAAAGGTIHLLTQLPLGSLDPRAISSPDALATATALLHRTLTSYAEDRQGAELVGDLATDTGHSPDGGRTWTFTLRPGLLFADGSPVTSADIAYGIARSFAPGSLAPRFLQTYLDPARRYRGPGGGRVPGVSTPDARTIRFSFADPHPDLPLVAALPVTTPVPAGRDSWVATGPYQVKPGSPGTLVRNPRWDPRTDPIRHQYPDQFVVEPGISALSQSQRVLADDGPDQTAVAFGQVPPSLLPQLTAVAGARDRVLAGLTPATRFVAINTRRVPDLALRRALNYAFDRAAYLRALGGPSAGAPATTVLSPVLPGHRDFDAYPGPDPARAKSLLAGRSPGLNYCFPSTPVGEAAAVAVRSALVRAGFRIVLVPLAAAHYGAVIAASSTSCDLSATGWSADLPHPSAVLPPLFASSRIRPQASGNVSFLAADDLDEQLRILSTAPDPVGSAEGFGRLDERIMREFAPVIPAVYERCYTLTGSRVGGAYPSLIHGHPALNRLWVR
jgi:peptide/nickel transport system substrate-binding protein